jgi:hypothetical protein
VQLANHWATGSGIPKKQRKRKPLADKKEKMIDW